MNRSENEKEKETSTKDDSNEEIQSSEGSASEENATSQLDPTEKKDQIAEEELEDEELDVTDDDDDDEDDDEEDDDEEDDEEDDDEEDDDEVKSPQMLDTEKEVVAVKPAAKQVNLKVASLVCLVLAGVSVLAAKTFSDQGILLLAGLFVFLGAYPAIKLDISDATKRFSVEIALIFGLCMVIFVVLRSLFPGSTSDASHAKILIIIMTLLGIRLIVWPIYTLNEEE